jgi:hypothetical protein
MDGSGDVLVDGGSCLEVVVSGDDQATELNNEILTTQLYQNPLKVS